MLNESNTSQDSAEWVTLPQCVLEAIQTISGDADRLTDLKQPVRCKEIFLISAENARSLLLGEKGMQYCGMSPDTKKPMFILPSVVPNVYLHRVIDKEERLKKVFGEELHIPTKNELNQIFNQRSLLNIQFDVDGEESWYYTSPLSAKGEGFVQNLVTGAVRNIEPYTQYSACFVLS